MCNQQMVGDLRNLGLLVPADDPVDVELLQVDGHRLAPRMLEVEQNLTAIGFFVVNIGHEGERSASLDRRMDSGRLQPPIGRRLFQVNLRTPE